MEKEFVPYELAVKLKAIGFNEPCFGLYAPPSKTVFLHHYGLLTAKEQVLAPLWQQAFRWFREPKNGSLNHLDFMYEYLKDDSMSYEEAELACLQKLIEIVETRTK
jgi:hypothetical protein